MVRLSCGNLWNLYTLSFVFYRDIVFCSFTPSVRTPPPLCCASSQATYHGNHSCWELVQPKSQLVLFSLSIPNGIMQTRTKDYLTISNNMSSELIQFDVFSGHLEVSFFVISFSSGLVINNKAFLPEGRQIESSHRQPTTQLDISPQLVATPFTKRLCFTIESILKVKDTRTKLHDFRITPTFKAVGQSSVINPSKFIGRTQGVSSIVVLKPITELFEDGV